ALWWIVGGALGGLAVALYLPPMQRIFKFEALAWHDLLFCAVAASAGILWPETVKVFPRMRKNLTARLS
ncbi:MAG: cation transporting ATPase C-terminal domain-containing protein, partial [Pseudomonadota bacterium]